MQRSAHASQCEADGLLCSFDGRQFQSDAHAHLLYDQIPSLNAHQLSHQNHSVQEEQTLFKPFADWTMQGTRRNEEQEEREVCLNRHIQSIRPISNSTQFEVQHCAHFSEINLSQRGELPDQAQQSLNYIASNDQHSSKFLTSEEVDVIESKQGMNSRHPIGCALANTQISRGDEDEVPPALANFETGTGNHSQQMPKKQIGRVIFAAESSEVLSSNFNFLQQEARQTAIEDSLQKTPLIQHRTIYPYLPSERTLPLKTEMEPCPFNQLQQEIVNSTYAMLPLSYTEEEPRYVNAAQFKRMMIMRIKRASRDLRLSRNTKEIQSQSSSFHLNRLQSKESLTDNSETIAQKTKKYKYESRHKHATNRIRDSKGRFIPKDKLQEYYEGLEREKREKEGSFDIESSNQKTEELLLTSIKSPFEFTQHHTDNNHQVPASNQTNATPYSKLMTQSSADQ